MIPTDLRYHKEHEWVRTEGLRATVGISDFAQEALGDIVYLETPKVGRVVRVGDEMTELESTKTTSPVYAPVGGKVVAVNDALKEAPEWINQDPYGRGWIVVIEMSAPEEVEALMTASAYGALLETQAH
jgi:glycine cleavage system H protein